MLLCNCWMMLIVVWLNSSDWLQCRSVVSSCRLIQVIVRLVISFSGSVCFVIMLLMKQLISSGLFIFVVVVIYIIVIVMVNGLCYGELQVSRCLSVGQSLVKLCIQGFFLCLWNFVECGFQLLILIYVVVLVGLYGQCFVVVVLGNMFMLQY